MNPQEQHEYDVAIQAGHQHFYENIPLYKGELLDLLKAVQKKLPELIVVKGARQWAQFLDNNTRLQTYRELELAYDNLPDQIVGSIGFDGDVYYVTSRLIENARFSAWNSNEYHTKKSKHMNNIVKEAVKHLLPTQFHEVVDESVNLFKSKIGGIRDSAIHAMRGKLNNTNNVLRDELFHMVAQGYVPKNKAFADAMEYVVASKDEYERNQNYDPLKAFVWIKPNEVVYRAGKDDPRQVGSTDELPEEIRGKLFVLMVSDKNTFIDEVGMKADDNKFWIIL